MKEYLFYVYILSSRPNGTLYIGVTNNLYRRVCEHKFGDNEGFTKLYKVDQLVYYEIYGDIRVAVYREKQIKKWRRAWKIDLIEKENKNWDDLFATIIP